MKDIVYEMIKAAESKESKIETKMDSMKASTFSITKWNELASELARARERIITLYELIGKLG